VSDPASADGPFAALYPQLLRLARAQLRRAGGTPTLNTTAVVHEAYLKLAAAGAQWEDRVHFLSLAARIMRQVVIDYARARAADKRGGGLQHVELDESAHGGGELVGGAGAPVTLDELLAIERGMGRLEEADPRLARLVELRFFAGLTHAEIAELQGLSERSIERDWRRARAILLAALVAPAGGRS
jgi:RNA polymerase sigma factor (TIGR02999 family)